MYRREFITTLSIPNWKVLSSNVHTSLFKDARDTRLIILYKTWNGAKIIIFQSNWYLALLFAALQNVCIMC